MDHSRFGPNTLTVDARTGLTFLDLTQSVDMSLREVRQEMLAGGEFFGFRHATPPEVSSLYLTAGFAPSFVPVDSPQFANVLRLIELVGTTHEEAGYPATHGVMSDQTAAFLLFNVIAQSYQVPDPSGFLIHYNLDYADPTLGHWLVVPEPSTLSLFIFVFGVFAIQVRTSRG